MMTRSGSATVRQIASSRLLLRLAMRTTLVVALAAGWVGAAELNDELQHLAGTPYIETLTGDAQSGERLPMIVALHYMGGSPHTSIADYGSLGGNVRLLSLAGPYDYDEGYSWFPPGYYQLDGDAQRDVTATIADRVTDFFAAAMEHYPTRGKPLLVGYSQGADLTHLILLRTPELVRAGLPMGGRFPGTWLVEANPTTAAEDVVLFHGGADEAVDVAEAHRAAAYYTKRGASVTLHVYANVGHAYPVRMRADYVAAIERLLDSLEN